LYDNRGTLPHEDNIKITNEVWNKFDLLEYLFHQICYFFGKTKVVMSDIEDIIDKNIIFNALGFERINPNRPRAKIQKGKEEQEKKEKEALNKKKQEEGLTKLKEKKRKKAHQCKTCKCICSISLSSADALSIARGRSHTF